MDLKLQSCMLVTKARVMHIQSICKWHMFTASSKYKRSLMKAATAVGVSEESKERLSVHIKFKFSNVYHQWYPH